MKLLISTLFILIFANCNTNEGNTLKSNIANSQPKIEEETTTPSIDTVKYNLFWLDSFAIENTLINRIPSPTGYYRKESAYSSFVHWIRRLPLKKGHPEVLLYNGKKKWNQDAHFAVFDLDIGNKDLQQCADATMRIRAEYLYHTKQYEKIHFKYTNGANVPYSKWKAGFYPIPNNKSVSWVKKEKCNGSYSSFKNYLIQIFNYAGTHSLSKELTSVPYAEMQIGDIFIKGGFPGHAVMVVDLVENEKGEKMYLLAQSYMPAQNFQLLNSPTNASPWYKLDLNATSINTPEWTFEPNQLMRWN